MTETEVVQLSKTVGETADVYVKKKKYLNISELPEGNTNMLVQTAEEEYDGKKQVVTFVESDGVKYKMPMTILEALKAQRAERTGAKKDFTWKVRREGTTINDTKYHLIVL